jgi:hypothetical protein
MSHSLPNQGIMLVYDITNEKSFDNIRNWIRNIEEVSVPFCFLSWAVTRSQEPGRQVEREE